MKLNILKIVLIVILSNLSLLFVLYYIFPISMPWVSPRQIFSNKKIEDRSITYAKLNEFSSDSEKSYQKAKISSLKILKDWQVIGWAALVSQDWYFVSAKHIFDSWNFKAVSYYGDKYDIENIWFSQNSDLLLWKLIYTGWKLDNFSLVDENFSPNVWAFVWIIGYPNLSTNDYFFLANIIWFWENWLEKNYIIDKKLFGWNSGWSVFDTNWNLMWIVSSSFPNQNFSYVLPINQWMIKNMINMSKNWKIVQPVINFSTIQNSYQFAKEKNLDDFDWYVVLQNSDNLMSWDIIYSINAIKVWQSKTPFQAIFQSQLSWVARFEILRNKQKSILQVPISFQ